MTKPCVFGYADVHPSHRDDYDAGYDQTFTFARHAEPDELDDEIFMLRERLTSGDVRDGVFWFLHGALAWTSYWYRPDGALDLETLTAQALAMILIGPPLR